MRLTTERVSEREVGEEVKGRTCLMEGLGAFGAARDACRNSCGTSLDAIMAAESCCGALREV